MVKFLLTTGKLPPSCCAFFLILKSNFILGFFFFGLVDFTYIDFNRLGTKGVYTSKFTWLQTVPTG